MKVFIQEIEELVVTDPQGLCNPPAPQLPSLPRGNPMPPQPQGWPTPQIPTPMAPFPGPTTPWPGVVRPGAPAIYTRHIHDPNAPLAPRTKWGVGGPTIQRAGDALEQEKWERNWQANQPEICQLSERSKRIMRGEDPDGN